MIELDGSMGEGGGQVLRSSLALSMVTRQDFRLRRVRSGRAKPGLQRQHLTALRAAAAVSCAAVEGDEIGSQEVVFRPGVVTAGDYHFPIGTAGSTTLVFQTVCLPLGLLARTSTVTLEGGTHNPMAPTWDFLDRVYFPLLARMGLRCESKLERHGFYPAGGGKGSVTVHGVASLSPLTLLEPGPVLLRRVVGRVAKLSSDIARREVDSVREGLGWGADTEVLSEKLDARQGPGNVVFAEVVCEHATEMFSSLGARGLRAEDVAAEVVREARVWLDAEVAVGEHLCDQLLLPMALAGGGEFTTVAPSLHSTTHAEVLRIFLGTEVRFDGLSAGRWKVSVRGQPLRLPEEVL